MRILIVGNGGREHALLWKLRRDVPEASFFVTRPNGGMAGECTAVDIAPGDVVALAGVGGGAPHRPGRGRVPEGPLAAGLADRMRQSGVPAFGPVGGGRADRVQQGVREGPDGGRGGAHGRIRGAHRPGPGGGIHRGLGRPGRRQGVGTGRGQGRGGVRDGGGGGADRARACWPAPSGRRAARWSIEEYMEGEEFSVFCLAHGEDFVPLLSSQDHKRIGEGDTGPNTGGMGAYAPVGFVTDALMTEVGERIVAPVLRAMAESGSPFSGLLYAGLMITANGPKVVEFNCRFGDPETQAVLPLLDSSLLEPMMAIAEGGGLAGHAPVFRRRRGGNDGAGGRGLSGRIPEGSPDLAAPHARGRGGLPRRHADGGGPAGHLGRARIGGHRHRRGLPRKHADAAARPRRRSPSKGGNSAAISGGGRPNAAGRALAGHFPGNDNPAT